MNAVKREMRYRKGTSMFDKDFAGDANDRESQTEQIFFLGNSAITWSIVKRKMMVLSS